MHHWPWTACWLAKGDITHKPNIITAPTSNAQSASDTQWWQQGTAATLSLEDSQVKILQIGLGKTTTQHTRHLQWQGGYTAEKQNWQCSWESRKGYQQEIGKLACGDLIIYQQFSVKN